MEECNICSPNGWTEEQQSLVISFKAKVAATATSVFCKPIKRRGIIHPNTPGWTFIHSAYAPEKGGGKS